MNPEDYLMWPDLSEEQVKRLGNLYWGQIKKEPMTGEKIQITDNIPTGIELITKERLEQKTKHNHTIKSDYELYPDFELVTLAEAVINGNKEAAPDCFPDSYLDKLMAKSYHDRLVIAGALLAAEIDRLNFTE